MCEKSEQRRTPTARIGETGKSRRIINVGPGRPSMDFNWTVKGGADRSPGRVVNRSCSQRGTRVTCGGNSHFRQVQARTSLSPRRAPTSDCRGAPAASRSECRSGDPGPEGSPRARCRRVSKDGVVPMNRPILVGMVSMALTGCADRGRRPRPSPATVSRLPPVGLTPIPNIYEALNQENPRLQPRLVSP